MPRGESFQPPPEGIDQTKLRADFEALIKDERGRMVAAAMEEGLEAA
ncbi:MAG: hypothetical protein V1664_04270 [Candidatus Uhrbacteria bacterium]